MIGTSEFFCHSPRDGVINHHKIILDRSHKNINVAALNSSDSNDQSNQHDGSTASKPSQTRTKKKNKVGKGAVAYLSMSIKSHKEASKTSRALMDDSSVSNSGLYTTFELKNEEK